MIAVLRGHGRRLSLIAAGGTLRKACDLWGASPIHITQVSHDTLPTKALTLKLVYTPLQLKAVNKYIQ
jgi:hypothetical protein